MEKVSAKELQDAFHVSGITDELYSRLVETLRYYDNMSGETFRAPTLGNATNGFLADELGEIRSELKPRTTLEKLLASVLKTRKEKQVADGEPDLVAKGEKWEVQFKWVSKMIVDGEKVKAYMADPAAFERSLGHPVGMDDLMKPSEYWEARTYPVTQA